MEHDDRERVHVRDGDPACHDFSETAGSDVIWATCVCVSHHVLETCCDWTCSRRCVPEKLSQPGAWVRSLLEHQLLQNSTATHTKKFVSLVRLECVLVLVLGLPSSFNVSASICISC